MRKTLLHSTILLALATHIGCGPGGFSFARLIDRSKQEQQNQSNNATSSTPTQTPSNNSNQNIPNASVINDIYTLPTVTKNKADVIFCIDNSKSMENDQMLLATHFQSFIEKVKQSGVDLQIGVVSSDPDKDHGKFLTKYYSEPFLKSSSENLIFKFKQNVRLGTNGSNFEQCMRSVTIALNPEYQKDLGFIRNDSVLSVIFITDEDEFLLNGDTPKARIEKLSEALKYYKSEPNDIRISYYINLTAKQNSPGSPTSPEMKSYPATYLLAAKTLLKGKLSDVTLNFSESFIENGSQFQYSFEPLYKLSRKPNSRIEVEINGVKIPSDPKNGFQYIKETNSIHLNGSSVLTNQGLNVKISYLPMQ